MILGPMILNDMMLSLFVCIWCRRPRLGTNSCVCMGRAAIVLAWSWTFTSQPKLWCSRFKENRSFRFHRPRGPLRSHRSHMARGPRRPPTGHAGRPDPPCRTRRPANPHAPQDPLVPDPTGPTAPTKPHRSHKLLKRPACATGPIIPRVLTGPMGPHILLAPCAPQSHRHQGTRVPQVTQVQRAHRSH